MLNSPPKRRQRSAPGRGATCTPSPWGDPTRDTSDAKRRRRFDISKLNRVSHPLRTPSGPPPDPLRTVRLRGRD
eukprot:1182032-Prorocentrum_minimum.AAC.2